MFHEVYNMSKSGIVHFYGHRFTVRVTTVLAMLVLAGLTWGIVSTHPGDTYSGGQDREIPISLWTSERGIVQLPQAGSVPASQKVTSRSAVTASAAIWPNFPGAFSNNREDSLYYFSSSNIVLDLEGYKAFLYLDIPPPGAPVCL